MKTHNIKPNVKKEQSLPKTGLFYKNYILINVEYSFVRVKQHQRFIAEKLP